jgi:hypothetical protein
VADGICASLCLVLDVGTELEWVAADYAMRIASGARAAQQTLDGALSELAAVNGSQPAVQYSSCPLLNISVCEPANASNYSLLLWNPQPRPLRSVVRLPVYGLRSGQTVTVRDAADGVVDSDLLPVLPTAASELAKNGSAPNAVAFVAHVPALGYAAYSVTADQPTTAARSRRGGSRRPLQGAPHQDAADELSIESAGVRLTFNTTSGLLTQWTDKSASISHAFSQNFFWYESSNTSSVGCSNAYYVSTSIHAPMPRMAAAACTPSPRSPALSVCALPLCLSLSLSRALASCRSCQRRPR